MRLESMLVAICAGEHDANRYKWNMGCVMCVLPYRWRELQWDQTAMTCCYNRPNMQNMDDRKKLQHEHTACRNIFQRIRCTHASRYRYECTQIHTHCHGNSGCSGSSAVRIWYTLYREFTTWLIRRPSRQWIQLHFTPLVASLLCAVEWIALATSVSIVKLEQVQKVVTEVDVALTSTSQAGRSDFSESVWNNQTRAPHVSQKCPVHLNVFRI